MPRKSWIAAEMMLARDDKKAALADYQRADKELREKTARLQALRLAKEAEEADAQSSSDAAAAKGKSKARRAKPRARPRSSASVWKSS